MCLLGPLLALAIASTAYCVRLGHLLFANITPIASSEISRQTGHETHIGSIRLWPPGLVTADSVAVSSLSTFRESRGEALLQAARIQIHYNLHDLLFDGGNAAHALGDIDVSRPAVLVERLAKNRYNFSDIIKPQQNRHAEPFAGQIIVRNGLLRFRDYLAPSVFLRRPALNTVSDVNATVNLHSERIAYFTADGRGGSERFAVASVAGDVSRVAAGRFRVHALVKNADAGYWATYFSTLRQARVTSGRADLDLTVSRLGTQPPPGLPVDLLGTVAVRQVGIALALPAFRHVALTAFSGMATFTGSGVTFSAQGSANGEDIAANGSVFDFSRPALAVTASAPRLDVEALAHQIPQFRWPAGLRLAPGQALIHAVGPAASPTISATVAFPRLQYQGNQLRALSGHAVLTGSTIAVPHLSFALPHGGGAAMHGVILLAKGQGPQMRIGGQAVGIDLGSFHLMNASKVSIGGTADVDFLANSIGQPLRLVADVAVARPRINRTDLLSARARVTYIAGQALTVTRGLIRTSQGAVLAGGTVPIDRSHSWNVRLDAAGLNLASLAGPYTKAPVGGLAYFQGRITGAAAAPSLQGQVQLLNPRYSKFTADVVRGGISVSRTALGLDQLTLDRFPTSASVSGTLAAPLSADPALDLRVDVSQADVQDFLDLARQLGGPAGAKLVRKLPVLIGTAAGAFQIGGTIRKPSVAGQATVTDALVGSHRLDRLHVAASYAGGTLNVAQVSAQGEGVTAEAHGRWRPADGRIAGAFDVRNVDLDELRAVTDTYLNLRGIASAVGTFGGSLASPEVAASVTADGLAINGQKLAPVSLSARYADGDFAQTGPPWTLDFLSPPGSGGDVRYVVNALRLFLPTSQHPHRTPAISLDAAIPTDAPETISHLVQTLRDSRYASLPAVARLLSRYDALPHPLDGTIAVPTLTVRGPIRDPSLQAAAEAQNLTLGADRLGSLTVSGAFAHRDNPTVTLDIAANGLIADGIPVSSVMAKASLANHVFALSEFQAADGDALLEASGKADFRPGGSVEASLDASNVPLALLDPLLPQPATERRSLTGQIGSLSVNASGPAAAPDLAASVNLTDPGLTVGEVGKKPRLSYALERIRSGKISVSTPVAGGSQVLTVTDLAAYQSGRPIASLSGSVPFRWPGSRSSPAAAAVPTDTAPLHAQLVVQDLSQIAPFLPALDPKRTLGTLTADLNVSQGEGVGAVTGMIDLSGGAVGWSGFDTALTKIQAHVSVDGDRLTIARATATSTKGGTVTIRGGSGLTLANADLTLTATGFTMDETSHGSLLSQSYGSAFRGRLDGAVSMAGPWLKPLLSTPPAAPLLVSDAFGSLPSAPSTPGSPAPPPAFDPRFDVAVLLGGKNKTITVTNALLRADANGSVDLAGRLSAPSLQAHMNIVRGQVILPPSTRLKFVRSASGNVVNVRYPAPSDDGSGQPGLRTEVDLTAQATVSISDAQLAGFRGIGEEEAPTSVVGVGAPTTPITSAAPGTGVAFNQPQTYTITAHIHGYLNDPSLQIDLESSPGGLSRQDMLVALTGVAGLQGISSQAALQAELAGALTSVGLPEFLSPLEDTIANSLALTDFDVAYSPDAPVLVTLGKEILPRLEVTYERFIGNRSNEVTALGQPPEYEIKLGYGIVHGLQISVSTDDQNDNTISLEGVASF